MADSAAANCANAGWPGWPEDLRRALCSRARRRLLTRGEALWREGDRALAFTCVESGLVKVARTASDGRETIAGIFGPGDSLGDAAVLGGGEYPADAVVASPRAAVWQSPAAPVLAAAHGNAAWEEALRRPLLQHTEILRQKIAVASAGAVPQRLAILLLHLAARFGDLSGARARVAVALTRGELAALVDARVETTIRILRQWEREGVLVTSADGFHFAAERLRAIAGE
ncbi:MAG: Crp/Fnr family transcriptional regulator [Terriglobales bacterium]